MTVERPSLPAFDRWRVDFGGRLTLWDYANEFGGVTLAVALGSIFWPELIDVDGCVLLAHNYKPDAFAAWREQFGERRDEIERVVNHVHVWDLFKAPRDEASDEEILGLATLMAKTWRCALAEQFPDRGGEVILIPDDYGPTLTLFTAHS